MIISTLYGKFLAPSILGYKVSTLGERSRVAGWMTVRGGDNVEIGDDFFAGPDFYLSTNSFAKINIGDAVMLGPEVMILGGNHDYSYSKSHMRFNQEEYAHAKDIVIESGVWIGARSMILSGANIHEGAVIGACSVVNKEVPPYFVAAGNNMRLIRPRFDSVESLERCLESTSSSYSVDDIQSIYEEYGFELK